MDAANALVPHGIGGHAREIISSFISELATLRTQLAEVTRERDEAQTDRATAFEALTFYANLGACACDKSCECGHCKARRLLKWAIDHPGMVAVNASIDNARFLAKEWNRLTEGVRVLKARAETAEQRIRALTEALKSVAREFRNALEFIRAVRGMGAIEVETPKTFNATLQLAWDALVDTEARIAALDSAPTPETWANGFRRW